MTAYNKPTRFVLYPYPLKRRKYYLYRYRRIWFYMSRHAKFHNPTWILKYQFHNGNAIEEFCNGVSHMWKRTNDKRKERQIKKRELKALLSKCTFDIVESKRIKMELKVLYRIEILERKQATRKG